MGMLILMADIYCVAEQPCSALPYALSAWLHATELGMDLKVGHPAGLSTLAEITPFNIEACCTLTIRSQYCGYSAESLAF